MKAIMTTTLMVLMTTATKAQDYSVNPYAIFGDTTAVLTAELPQASAILAVPIATDDSQTATAVFDFLHRQAFLYDNQGQLLVADTLFEGQKGIWQNVDPKAGDYPHVSPYGYCMGNPVILKDPDGRDTEVVQTGQNTYRVVGGTANKDLNVYVVDPNFFKRTGQILGITLTSYSFKNEDGSSVIGSIIDLSDFSGKRFWTQFQRDTPDIFSYMLNATEHKIYDYKNQGIVQGGTQQDIHLHHNRGMKVLVDGVDYIASARDIGNMAAGYVAGINGLSWAEARMGFDILETIQHRLNPTIEGLPTQQAQKFGMNVSHRQNLRTHFGEGVFNFNQSLKTRTKYSF